MSTTPPTPTRDPHDVIVHDLYAGHSFDRPYVDATITHADATSAAAFIERVRALDEGVGNHSGGNGPVRVRVRFPRYAIARVAQLVLETGGTVEKPAFKPPMRKHSDPTDVEGIYELPKAFAERMKHIEKARAALDGISIDFERVITREGKHVARFRGIEVPLDGAEAEDVKQLEELERLCGLVIRVSHLLG